jgi:HAD superfamily hydrolase (TIGR01509 family)
MNSEKFLGNFSSIPSFKQLLQKLPSLKLVLFDMDGTLIDSEPVHAKAFVQALHQHGVTLPKDISHHELVQRYKGMADTEVVEKLKIEKILNHNISSSEILQQKHLDLLKVLQTQKLSLHPEMASLLTNIELAGCQMGIVTASERQVLDVVVDVLNIRTRMQILLGRQDTHATKPHPAPYLEAMARMNIDPQETIILEDSNTGLAAANACGAYFLKAEWFS